MPYEAESQSCRKTLVLGIGNTLRRDDGVGAEVIHALQMRDFPEATLATVHQLTPELAEEISQSDVVVFVDAAVGEDSLRVAQIEGAAVEPQPLAHDADPASLVAFARDQYGRAPEAWAVGIPAFDMGYGEGLSDQTHSYLNRAIEAVTRIIKQPCMNSP